eukprot:5259490-Prymnesium_polylepis.1
MILVSENCLSNRRHGAARPLRSTRASHPPRTATGVMWSPARRTNTSEPSGQRGKEPLHVLWAFHAHAAGHCTRCAHADAIRGPGVRTE